MPRYFFNTRIGSELIPDPQGAVLRDADQAWDMARAMIQELLEEEGGQSSLLSAIIEVTDENGAVVFEFPFAEAMMPPPDKPQTRH